jgi:hypothetical protein
VLDTKFIVALLFRSIVLLLYDFNNFCFVDLLDFIQSGLRLPKMHCTSMDLQATVGFFERAFPIKTVGANLLPPRRLIEFVYPGANCKRRNVSPSRRESSYFIMLPIMLPRAKFE